jgi:hypothetical protein
MHPMFVKLHLENGADDALAEEMAGEKLQARWDKAPEPRG